MLHLQLLGKHMMKRVTLALSAVSPILSIALLLFALAWPTVFADAETDILVPGTYYTSTDDNVTTTYATPAVVRVVGGAYEWHIGAFLKQDDTYVGQVITTWGLSTDKIVSGHDFDGDGLDDITVYRPGTGAWLVLKSSCNRTCYTSYILP